MKLFGVPALPTGPAAVVMPHLPDLDDQRRLIARARSESRRWLLRAVLLVAIGALAFRRGWFVLGLAFFALGLLVLQLSRSNTRQAAELEKKLALLEGK
jgi:hypothetical protein